MSNADTIIATSGVWQHHPDGLALLTATDVGRPDHRHTTIAVNPAMERLFASNELVGHSAALMVPSIRLSTTNDGAEVFSARRLDGTTFAVTSSFVELAVPDDVSMLVVRDVSALVAWRGELPALRSNRLEQVELREQVVAKQSEKLTQHLYAAGIALRLCKETGASEASQHNLERTLEVLDQVMNDLIAGA